jgi:hypothetical protein
MTEDEIEELRALFTVRRDELHEEWLNARRALAKLPPRPKGRPKTSDDEKREALKPHAHAARLVIDLIQEFLHKQSKKKKPRKNVPAAFMKEAVGIACAIHPSAKKSIVRDLVNRHRKFDEAKFTLVGYIHRVRVFE